MQREIRQASGLFLALLSLVAQLTMAAAVPATTISLAGVTTLCQHDSHSGAPPTPAHPLPDCPLCLVCHGAPVSFGLLTATPALPQPTAIRFVNATILRSASTPPPSFDTTAQPRGPPIPA